MKKRNSSRIIIKIWKDHKIWLYLPKLPSKGNKPNIYFHYPDPATGKRKRIRIYKSLSYNYPLKKIKENAKILVDEIIENLQVGLPPLSDQSGNGMALTLTSESPITQCFNSWLVYRNECFEIGALKKKGYLSGQNTSTFFMEWLREKNYLFKTVGSFNHLEIDLFLKTWAKKRKWNKVSYNTYRGHLITFFNYLIAIKVIADNPARHSKKLNLKNDSSRFVIYEEEELRQVVKALIADDNYFDLYVAAKLIFKYNIRPIELIRVQVKDIDFDKQILVLSSDKTKNGNEARFSLDEESLNLLQRFTGKNQSNQYLFGRGLKGSAHQACDGYLDQRWRTFRKLYNIPVHLKFYALKHSSNYYDLQNGASFEEIRQRNRHSNLQVTTLYIKERLFKNVIKPSSSSKF